MCDKTTLLDVSTIRLRELIDNAQKTREEIGNGVGLDTSTITKYYNGDRKLTIEAVKKFSKYFNVSADYLLGLSDAKTKNMSLQAICDFTGLSVDAILKLREYNTPDFSSATGVSEEDVLIDINFEIRAVENDRKLINNFILSSAFDELVTGGSNAKRVNDAFMAFLAIYFGDYEYFFELYPDTEKTLSTVSCFCSEHDHDSTKGALNDEMDLSTFQVQKAVLNYFDELSNLSEIKDKNLQRTFDWVRFIAWKSVQTAFEENNSIEDIQKYIQEFKTEDCQKEISALKKIYERLKTTPKIK